MTKKTKEKYDDGPWDEDPDEDMYVDNDEGGMGRSGTEGIAIFYIIWIVCSIIMFFVNIFRMDKIVTGGGWNAVRFLVFFSAFWPLGIWINIRPEHFNFSSTDELRDALNKVASDALAARAAAAAPQTGFAAPNVYGTNPTAVI